MVIRSFLLSLLLSIPVFATQVTMTATTISNFHPPSLPAAVTGTLSATNGSATLTGNFRAQWINLGGFRISIAGTDYTVSNVSSNTSITLTASYSGSTGSKSYTVYPFVVLRFYALQRFTESTTLEVIQPGTPGGSAWYKQLACSVIGTTLYIPQTTLPSTTNAINPGERNAKWYAAFYYPSGGFISIWDGLSSFALDYTPNPKTWTQAIAYANPGISPPPNTDTYSKSQIDALFHVGGGGGTGTVTSIGTSGGLQGGTITSTGTISIADIIGSGSCTSCNLTYNSKGQITVAANGSGTPGGTVTSITAGAGLSGGTITTTGTISLPDVVTAGTCTSCDLTIDAKGRVTAKGNGAGGSSASPTGRWVLRLNGLGESVLADSQWYYSNTYLPAVSYEAWINVDPAFAGSGGYIFADGGGGAHAVLFGVGSVTGGVRLTGNVCGPVCNGGDTRSYTGNRVFPKGEWHHVAWTWTGTTIELFVDGMPDGIANWSGPRYSPGSLGAAGPLYIGGSDHNNFQGKLAGIRVWEGLPIFATSPFSPGLAFTHSVGVNSFPTGYAPALAYDLSTPGNFLPDLSNGFRGYLHHGQVINSNFANGNANPIRGTWEYDSTAPTSSDTWTPPVGNTPVAPAIPSGAKIWDSFSYPDRTLLQAGCCGILSPTMPPLNNTDAGASLGAKVWQYEGAYVFGPIGIWGYFDGKVVNLNRYNGAQILNTAVVDTTVSDGTFCIDREQPEAVTGTITSAATSLFFRYVDVDNNWWLLAPGVSGATVNDIKVWKRVSGSNTLVNTVAGTANWRTLCAVTLGSSITITTDGNVVYTFIDSALSTATKAGIGGGTPDPNIMLYGHAKWDNFLVK